ncbi:MAG: UDP-3-O-(3-hydroxymyristoyl)glucosamine N-acyltransferase [Spirulina sp. SIO3F2]|nr:UDP-3-O-(3-hydroxymyristoyl)glucosamine N-acyltransferase [Spirulina sp. SIO3F2]
MKFSDLIAQLEPAFIQASSLTAHPDCNPELVGVASVEVGQSERLSYIENAKFAAFVATTGAGALVLPDDPALSQQASDRGIAWLTTPNPKLLYAMVIEQFYQPYRPQPQIHPTAVIDPTVQLGSEVAIGAHVVIEAGCIIGDRVCIFPNVTIYPGVEIGADTVLHANCVIEEQTKIGQRCVIHSGAVIGGEGFGFVPHPPQGWYKLLQGGKVVLEDEVEVGCNSTIDRPPSETTYIGTGTKIDNLVQIAHGCQVGQHTVMSSQVGLSGRVKVGNWVLLAGQVGIANQVEIGDGAIATAQSGLHKDVAPKAVVSGTPAIDNKLWLKVSAAYNRLPELLQTVRRLKRQQK